MLCKRAQNREGFTLVELLVALTILGIVTASITQMFTRMSFGYTTQTSHADLQQSVRAVLDLMTREIRMAGFSSHNVEGFGISRAEEDLVAFTVDWDDDGFVTPSHSDDPSIFFESDSITYTLNGEDKSLRRITAEDSASESSQSLLGGAGDWMQVAELRFAYFDEQERETDALADIRSVGVTITAAAPAGRKGMIRKTYRTRIRCRNLGL
jgi:prepilin-type N-terminal cleavage/methylation domain-containing protein